MDRFVLRRRHLALLMALTLIVPLWPAGTGRAAPPNISDEPAGDPGDGVLRPADVSSATASIQGSSSAAERATAPDRGSPTFLLVPCPAPAGLPWPLVFRLIPVDSDAATRFGLARPSWHDGRWHRAP